ncbi:hypothetical protein EDF56_11041 [Novosphingobium sp. PhB165]|uniref:integrase n=1 Tax=Novosphingobium sp. PhB165 TaxID=2485105 RepID=UPI001043C264|nr:integrase [Novosphingobium sp. PhB165]TCM15361.1 hypothetical protein EDF56_11041 [Novosphingobium sp. PhB165]
MTRRPSLELAAAEVVTVFLPGEAVLPQRRSGEAIDRTEQLTRLVRSLVSAKPDFDEPALRRALEARAPAGVKALASDLDDYAAFDARHGGIGLPAREERVAAYVNDCERRGLSLATVQRRLASLTAVHDLLGLPGPARKGSVRDAFRAMRRRAEPRGRDAGRAIEAFTLEALLAACPTTPAGLRDAAMLSLGHDAELRVSELIGVTVAHLVLHDDGFVDLEIVPARNDGAGEGRRVRLTPETVRRIDLWREVAGLDRGPLLRRVSVVRTKAREGREAVPLAKLGWNHRQGEGNLGERRTRPATSDYAIGETAMTQAAIRLIVKRAARRAAEQGFVALQGRDLDAAISVLGRGTLRWPPAT